MPRVANGVFKTGTGLTPVFVPTGFDPTGLDLRWTGRTSAGVASATIQAGFGVVDSSSQACISGADKHAQNPTQANHGARGDAAVWTLDNTGADDGVGTITLGSGGFLFTPTDAFSVDLEVHFVAFGGTRCKAGVTANEPATATTAATTGVGFRPRLVRLLGMGGVSSYNGTRQVATDFNLTTGYAIRTQAGTIKNAVIANGADAGVATTSTRQYFRSTAEDLACFDSTASATPKCRSGISTMDVDGFTQSWNVVVGSGTRNYLYLAVEHGTYELQQFTTSVTTSATFSVTPGFRVAAVIVGHSGRTAESTAGGGNATGRFLYGSAVGLASQFATGTRDSSGLTGGTCTTVSNATNSLVNLNDGALSGAAQITSISATQVTWTMTTGDSAANLGFALSIGSEDRPADIVGQEFAAPTTSLLPPFWPPSWLPAGDTLPAAPNTSPSPPGAPSEEAAGPVSALATVSAASGSSEEIPGAVTVQLGGQGLPPSAPSEELGGPSSGAVTASAAGGPSTETAGAVTALAGGLNNIVAPGTSEEKQGAPSALVLAAPSSGDSEEFPGAVTAIAGNANQVAGEPSREAGGASSASAIAATAGARTEELGGSVAATPQPSSAGAASGEAGGAPSATSAPAPVGASSGEQGGAASAAAAASTAGAASAELGGAVTALQGNFGFPAGEPARDPAGAVTTLVTALLAGGGSGELGGPVMAVTVLQAFPAGAPSTEAAGPSAVRPAPAPASARSEERGGAVMAVVVASAGPGARSEETPGSVVGGPLNVTYCFVAGAPSEERPGSITSTSYSIPPWLIAGPGTSTTYSLVVRTETFSIIVDADTED